MAERRVEIQEGIVVGTGGDRTLHCDVYRPPASMARGLGVLILFGGGWRIGSLPQQRGYASFLSRRGYLCVCCEYRLSAEALWPAQLEDAKLALRWMRANAAGLEIDRDRIAVYGPSAGAHLALMLAATPNVPEFEGGGGHGGVPTDVATVMVTYPPTDFTSVSDVPIDHLPLDWPSMVFDEAVTQLLGSGHGPELRRAASPLHYVGPQFPPTMLLHGTEDQTVALSQSLDLHEALRANGVPVELHTFSGVGHGFDWTPGPTPPRPAAEEPDYAAAVAHLMLLFLKRHLAS